MSSVFKRCWYVDRFEHRILYKQKKKIIKKKKRKKTHFLWEKKKKLFLILFEKNKICLTLQGKKKIKKRKELNFFTSFKKKIV